MKRSPVGRLPLRHLSRSAVFVGTVGLACTLSGSRVLAEPSAIDPEVARLSEAVDHASGPAVYAALRDLMNLWDYADPNEVESAVRAAAENPALSAPAKVYAQLLLAEARKRRGDDAASGAIVDKLGFVKNWLFVGPFDNENKTGLDRTFQPEQELDDPIVPGRAFDGKERPVRYREAPGGTHATFDFGAYLRPRESVCGFATTFLKPKQGSRTPRTISVWVGAEGAFKLYRNGDEVLSDPAYRDYDLDRVATSIKLDAGVTRLTIKVCGDRNVAPLFTLRTGDERGAPDLDIESSADLSLWADHKKDEKKGPEKKPGPIPATGIEGPVQAFNKATADKNAQPRALADYARYLITTHGDPRGEHKARDMAEQSVDAAPTVDNLLFTAGLAEDRNQARAFIERAKEALKKEKDGPDAARHTIDLLLAEARLERSGVGWRDAVPYYDQVLEKDPENVFAALGRVELYLQAGLPRSALASLDRMVAARPRSISLLRVYALQLRAVGRDAEASEADARWFAFRSDDTAYLRSQLDRAIAARDEGAAEHWLHRFLAVSAEGVFAETTASEAYRALGKPDKSRLALESALDYAPDDTSTLRALADLAGEGGQREEQLRLMRKILALSPQDKEARQYVEHIEPPKAREDEAYAWDKETIQKLADQERPKGYPRRTLRDLSVTTVFQNGLASHFHQLVFQPLTDEGAARARQFGFGYHGDSQQVEVRAARVYHKDGSVAEAVESGEAAANDPSIAMYTSERTFYIQFPRLEPGDIVELRYRVDDTALKNDIADSFGEIEYMQNDEPIKERKYVLITPKTRKIHAWSKGLTGLAQNETEKGDERIFTFEAHDVPALTPEPAMPPYDEVLAQVQVSTFDSWQEMGSFYWNLARDQFDGDEDVKKKVLELTKGLKDDASKVRAIYKYVTDLRYVALEFGIEGIKPRRCALTMARGWGDCKDKATTIVTMLREIGVPSTIVIVRTQMRGGLSPDAPANMASFDHAIAYVPSLDLYLDGTAEGAGSTELPTMDRNAVALQVNEGKAKLVHLPTPGPEASPQNRKFDLTLAADGSAEFAFDSYVGGANAIAWRERYHAEGTRRERATRDLSGALGAIEIGKSPASVAVKDIDDVEKPVSLGVRGKALAYARSEGSRLSVPVASPRGLTSEYAGLSSRTQDVVLGALTTTTDERTIKIPAGMKIESLPDPVNLDTAFGTVQLTVESQPGKVVAKSTLILKKARISPSEYAAFRAFCEKADNAFSERLLLAP